VITAQGIALTSQGEVDVILGRRQVFAAIASIALLSLAAPILHAATAPTRKDRLASAIENRLNRLGDTTNAMTRSEGYFYRNPTVPQRAFYAYAGCQQAFRFSVFVYKTEAQAVAMYDYFYQHVVNIGGDFHAFNMVRRGRVIYSAATASAPDPNAPAVPKGNFHSLVAEVSAPLPRHPRGCTPQL
jgi:hypothetical protein